ncbi:hypothetical protein [Nocardia sp. Marseille-Q1738]
MKLLRLPADPAKAAKNYLALAVPGMVAAPAPTFGMVVPKDWTPSSAPHLAVFDDSGPARWPVTTRPLLRVTVWADGRDRSRAIAGAALGVLLSHRIPGIATITEPSLLLEARDSTNGGVLASFTVRAQARTLPL